MLILRIIALKHRFSVRASVIRQWLYFLKEWHSCYRDVIIDENNVDKYPADDVPECLLETMTHKEVDAEDINSKCHDNRLKPTDCTHHNSRDPPSTHDQNQYLAI